MITRKEIEQALQQTLPDESQDQVLYLSILLTSLINQTISPETFIEQLSAEPVAENVFSKLAGRSIKGEKVAISFGEGSQMGDISVSDIAGNNIFKPTIHINIHTYNQNPQRSRVQTQKTAKTTKFTTIDKIPRNSYKSNSKSRDISSFLENNNIHLLPGNILHLAKIGIFSVFGLFFGWYTSHNIINPESNIYYESTNLAIPIIASIIGSSVGLLIGLELSSKKKRISGVAWWGHILGICFIGTLASSPTNNPIPGTFWIVGVLGWGVIWFLFLGGYRELR